MTIPAAVTTKRRFEAAGLRAQHTAQYHGTSTRQKQSTQEEDLLVGAAVATEQKHETLDANLGLADGRRRDCCFADIPCPSLLKYLLKG